MCGCGRKPIVGDASEEEHVLSNEYESLDYEDVHNKIFVKEEKDRGEDFSIAKTCNIAFMYFTLLI